MILEKDAMLSSVEAWWAGLCALPFDGAQGDNLFFWNLFIHHAFSYAIAFFQNHL